jgi:hypothetical protein
MRLSLAHADAHADDGAGAWTVVTGVTDRKDHPKSLQSGYKYSFYQSTDFREVTVMPTGSGLDVATLVTWLATEALGAFMVRSWIARGGTRAAMSVPSWIVFVVTAAKPAAWLALVLMGPAIGLGISTVTIWTPYPGGPRQPEAAGSAVVPDSEVKRALEDEGLTGQLVDDLLARNLAPASERDPGWYLRPLVPAGHGILAIATFALAVLSAITAG